MNFETIGQSVQYVYATEDGKNKGRVLKNVKESATPENLVAVGKVFSDLTSNQLKAVTLIKREGIDLGADSPAQ